MKRILLSLSFILGGVVLGGCSLLERQETVGEAILGIESAGGFKVSSPVFENGREIPGRYTKVAEMGGRNFSIPLNIRNAPAGTEYLAIAMTDVDADNFVHWLITNIPVGASSIPERASPNNVEGTEHINGYGEIGYGGPNPPAGETHAYRITAYALKDGAELNLAEDITLDEFTSTIDQYIVGQSSLTGYVTR